MSKRENDANNIFRPSDSGLTKYEKEKIALRKNLERLKAERLAREVHVGTPLVETEQDRFHVRFIDSPAA